MQNEQVGKVPAAKDNLLFTPGPLTDQPAGETGYAARLWVVRLPHASQVYPFPSMRENEDGAVGSAESRDCHQDFAKSLLGLGSRGEIENGHRFRLNRLDTSVFRHVCADGVPCFRIREQETRYCSVCKTTDAPGAPHYLERGPVSFQHSLSNGCCANPPPGRGMAYERSAVTMPACRFPRVAMLLRSTPRYTGVCATRG